MATAVQDRVFEADLAGIPLPATLRPPVPLTDDELIAFSRRNRPYRIELNARGEIEIMTPVGAEGGHLEALVTYHLARWAEENGGICFGPNTGFRLPDSSVLSPDAAWISETSWRALSKEQRRRYAPLCPEFVIEILSVSDSRATLKTKMATWISNGASLAWMIDPYAAAVRIYRSGEPVETLLRPDFLEAGEPVAGFRLPLEKLWDV